MTDLAMRKRAAVRAGEVGLFVDAAPFEEDFGHIKLGAEVQVKATTPRSLRQHKFAWALATKIAEACDWLETKDDAMEYLLIEAKHFRRIYDPIRKIAHLRPKPTNWGAMDGTEYTRLLKRMTHVAVTQVCPGLEEGPLRAEIEAMIGPDVSTEHLDRQSVDQPKRRTRRNQSLAEGQPSREEVVGSPDTQGTGQEPVHVAPPEEPPPATRAEGATITTAAQYIARAREWIKKQRNHQVAVDFLDDADQINLRKTCKVSVGELKMLKRELAQHFEEAK